MNRFFVELKKEDCFILNEDQLQHIKVLRLKASEEIICIYKEEFYVCKMNDKTAKIIKKLSDNHENDYQIIACLPIIDYKRFEWMLQKCVELGVSSIVPTFTQRTNVKPKEINDHRVKRWNQIVRSAAEQSFRNIIPKINEPHSFDEVIKLDGLKIVAHEIMKSENNNINTYLNNENKIILLVGPEGGFTENEIDLAQASNAVIISLGKRILRSETAMINLISMINFSKNL